LAEVGGKRVEEVVVCGTCWWEYWGMVGVVDDIVGTIHREEVE